MINALTVTNLNKSYGKTKVLSKIDFSVKVGQIFSFLGPNGVGKTTLMKTIVGLEAPDAGEILVFGQKNSEAVVKEKIGMQLEQSFFDNDIKVSEIFELFGSFYHKPLKKDQILHDLGLEDKGRQFYSALSMGWKQRVNIGLALLHNPDLLILDEVSESLDPKAKRELWETLRRLKKRGKTIILTTHDTSEAEALADQVAILRDGQIAVIDEPKKLLKNFEESYKVEYYGESLGASELIDYSFSIKDKHLLVTKRPSEVEKLVRQISSEEVQSAPVNFEDVYLIYSSKEIQ